MSAHLAQFYKASDGYNEVRRSNSEQRVTESIEQTRHIHKRKKCGVSLAPKINLPLCYILYNRELQSSGFQVGFLGGISLNDQSGCEVR